MRRPTVKSVKCTRLPAYLGSSFAFISPVLAVCATPGMSYGDAQGGFIVFGLGNMS